MSGIVTMRENLEVPESELLEASLTELSESIKTKLVDLSEIANIDMNTLWIAFETSMEDLKNDFKKEYL